MQNNRALLVIDMQNDFLDGGALPVPGSLQIIPHVNQLIEKHQNVIFTQDWHPKDHISFLNNSWPEHCLQGSFGAEIHKDINTQKGQLMLRKGYKKDIDSYSAFIEQDKKTHTGLASYLKERDIEKLTICGLALDFCVGYSALDAADLGFDVEIVLSACCAIDIDNSMASMLDLLNKKNVTAILGNNIY